jgi:hypothetical protein
MTVEPETLGAVIALVLGRKPDKALVADLARVLDQREEVLPWLVLRQGAFADDADVLARLHALAGAGNRASHHRPAGPVMAPETHARKRDVEVALGRMIADNIAGTGHSDAIGAMLHAHNATLPGRPGYDFRRRIVEQAPVPDPTVAADGEPDAGETVKSAL